MKKLNASVFLKAANLIEKDVKKKFSFKLTCCAALCKVAEVVLWELHETPEYKFFKKHYGKKKAYHDYWFGAPYKWTYNKKLGRYETVPHVTNQKKRVAVLKKAYKAAKKFNKQEEA